MKHYIALLFLVFLISCSTSKKVSKEVYLKRNNDSTVTITTGDSSTLKVDSVKKETKQATQSINLEYDPSLTQSGDVEIMLNGNVIKVPTKGLKHLNTNQATLEYKVDSVRIDESQENHSELKVETHTNEIITTKEKIEKKGWLANLFSAFFSSGGGMIIYIIIGLILVGLGIFIWFWLKKRRRKNAAGNKNIRA